MTTQNELGAAIRARRKELGISQDVLSRDAKVNRTTISDLEQGIAGCQLSTYIKLVNALKLKIVFKRVTE